MGYCGKSKKYMLFQPRTTVRRFQEHSPRRRSFGVAIAFAFVIIVIFFSAVVFLFIVFLVGLFSKDIGTYQSIS